MYSSLSIRHQGATKVFAFVFSMLIFLLPIFQISHLEAGGWGKTQEVVNYEETNWNSVYFDVDGFNLTASIPNYSGASLSNGMISIWGKVETNTGYVITTSYGKGFTPPKTLKDFVKLIQDANPGYQVNPIEAKGLGAKFAVDMIPVDPEYTAFWRYLSTDNRLIKMGSDDTNDNRRIYFFESIYIR